MRPPFSAQDSAQDQSSAQYAAANPKFDVASVKPSVPRPPAAGGAGGRVGGFGGGGGRCPESFKMDRSRVDISPDRVTGPDLMMGLGSPRSERCDWGAAGDAERRWRSNRNRERADREG